MKKPSGSVDPWNSDGLKHGHAGVPVVAYNARRYICYTGRSLSGECSFEEWQREQYEVHLTEIDIENPTGRTDCELCSGEAEVRIITPDGAHVYCQPCAFDFLAVVRAAIEGPTLQDALWLARGTQ